MGKIHTSRVNIATLLFLVISVTEILAVAFRYRGLEMIIKPLLMISLMFLYVSVCSKRDSWYLAALFFSFLGDVFLLDKEGMFLYGVGSFLMAQLLYVRIVSKQMKGHPWKGKMLAALPFAVYLLLLIGLLRPNLGPFLVPVVVYGLAISLFGTVSLMHYLGKRDRDSMLLLVGALLFIVSDSMIALNKFHGQKGFYPTAIMVTYIAAQYLIFRFMAQKCLVDNPN